MALITCKECGGQVSSKAAACPKCGAKPPAKTSLGTALFAGLIGLTALVMIVGSFGEKGPTIPATKPGAAAPTITPEDRGMQSARLKFIKKMMNEGLVKKIETPGTIPRVWVTPRFQAQDYDFKESTSRAILAYYYVEDQRNDMITLWDTKSGKKIGSYSKSAGFDLD